MSRAIAVIPGDGIGPEVVAAALPILRAALGAGGSDWRWDEMDWNSARYLREGAMMPEDAFETLRRYDSVFFGAVGDPRVPDDIPVWGLVLAIRREFDLFVNLRPIRWLDGVAGTLAHRRPDEVNMVFVRENTEGEYSNVGSIGDDAAEQVSRFTRAGTERAAARHERVPILLTASISITQNEPRPSVSARGSCAGGASNPCAGGTSGSRAPR